MSLNDPLANALSNVLNGEKVAKKTVTLSPSNKMIKEVLKVMQENRYIGTSEEQSDIKGNTLIVNLIGKINNCGAIKPRFPVKVAEFEKFEKRYLPAKEFGMLIISTPQGIMTQKEAKTKSIGGKLLAYCY